MIEKKTEDLELVLGNTHASNIQDFLHDNSSDMIIGTGYFGEFLKDIAKRNRMLLQDVFLNADIPERYGYRLISGERHTKQRDIILRLCYGAGMSLEEAQKALKIYAMPGLYSRIPRDAILMVCFIDRPDSLSEIDELLKKNGEEPLRTCGTIELE